MTWLMLGCEMPLPQTGGWVTVHWPGSSICSYTLQLQPTNVLRLDLNYYCCGDMTVSAMNNTCHVTIDLSFHTSQKQSFVESMTQDCNL